MEQTGLGQRFFGGGEIGTYLQHLGWPLAGTATPGAWPADLRLAITLLLSSKEPQCLFWGPDHLLFYNDAFRPLLNGHHPTALGRPAGTLPGEWTAVDRVIGTGQILEEQSLPIYNGEKDDTTFTLTPLPGTGDAVAGVLATVARAIRPEPGPVEHKEAVVWQLFAQAPLGIIILHGYDFVVEMANDYCLRLVGRGPEIIGRPLWETMPEVREQDFDRLMRQVLNTGISLRSSGHKLEIMRAQMDVLYVDFVYEPLKDVDGTINRIMVVVTEVTEQVMARHRIEDAEERARLAVEAAQLGTFDYDITTGEVITSPRFDTIFGLDGASSHKSYIDRLHPEDLATRAAAHARSLEEGELFYEARVLWPDASEHWVRVQGRTYWTDGQPHRLLGTVLDITKSRKAEQALTRTAERLNLALQAGKLGSYEMSLPEGLIECTAQCKYNFGLAADATLNYQRLLSLILPEDRSEMEKAVAVSLENNTTYTAEYRVLWPDGSVHWVYAAGLPIYNMDGRAVTLTGVTVDITERKRFTEFLEHSVEERTRELDESNQQLRRTNAELEQFAYVASHDLQEPLRKVRTFTEMLNEHLASGDERTRELLAKISSSSARMLTLIRDVLNFSQLSVEGERYSPVDLDELMKEVCEDFELLIEQKGAVITTSGLPVIEGIPLQLSQLFANLVSNSLKFSVAGKPPRISVSARMMDSGEVAWHQELNPALDYYCIEFSDNGIGFAQEHANQIFSMFQRLHDRQSYSGTGIGLALCKKIVTNHHGDIYARAAPDKGAIFHVLLPATQAGHRAGA